MKLRMDQQPALIGLDITKAKVQLQTTAGRVEIETNPAQLDIQSPDPQLHIDQSQCFADKGFKSISRFMTDWVAEARSDYMSGLARIVSKGNQLAKIKGASIADIAGSGVGELPRFNVQAIPKQPPVITCEVHPVQIDYQAAKVNTNYIPAIVESNNQPGRVETYLKQKPALKINWVGNNVDSIA